MTYRALPDYIIGELGRYANKIMNENTILMISSMVLVVILIFLLVKLQNAFKRLDEINKNLKFPTDKIEDKISRTMKVMLKEEKMGLELKLKEMQNLFQIALNEDLEKYKVIQKDKDLRLYLKFLEYVGRRISEEKYDEAWLIELATENLAEFYEEPYLENLYALVKSVDANYGNTHYEDVLNTFQKRINEQEQQT